MCDAGSRRLLLALRRNRGCRRAVRRADARRPHQRGVAFAKTVSLSCRNWDRRFCQAKQDRQCRPMNHREARCSRGHQGRHQCQCPFLSRCLFLAQLPSQSRCLCSSWSRSRPSPVPVQSLVPLPSQPRCLCQSLAQLPSQPRCPYQFRSQCRRQNPCRVQESDTFLAAAFILVFAFVFVFAVVILVFALAITVAIIVAIMIAIVRSLAAVPE